MQWLAAALAVSRLIRAETGDDGWFLHKEKFIVEKYDGRCITTVPACSGAGIGGSGCLGSPGQGAPQAPVFFPAKSRSSLSGSWTGKSCL
ncbi:hypothetical protein KR767_09000 [Luteibacter anthropi]|uniref:hypothetical protein n=1 Tax=Luteibacter anthropi TaxID=564369 RepID=UPI0020323508|nr:hypothetical protein [Luteibacter anthropi]URX64163.1 hypothetical protein KR767_09000 [Luteibacter anthropi]